MVAEGVAAWGVLSLALGLVIGRGAARLKRVHDRTERAMPGSARV